MAMLNEDQREYSNYIHSVDAARRCWCGWYLLGQCPHCPAGKTCADKMREDPWWIARIAAMERQD